MKRYLVPKNIETTPLVRGLKPRYFYLVYGMLILEGLGLAPYLFSFLANKNGVFKSMIIYITVALLLLVVTNNFLKKKSKATKYKFKKERKVISNKDLYNYL